MTSKEDILNLIKEADESITPRENGLARSSSTATSTPERARAIQAPKSLKLDTLSTAPTQNSKAKLSSRSLSSTSNSSQHGTDFPRSYAILRTKFIFSFLFSFALLRLRPSVGKGSSLQVSDCPLRQQTMRTICHRFPTRNSSCSKWIQPHSCC